MKHVVNLLVVVSMVLFTSAHGDERIDSLKVFKSHGMQHGRWQMELLDTTDASMKSMIQKAGKISACMDFVDQWAKKYQHENGKENACSPKIIKDLPDSAELEISCKNGDGSGAHVTINRDGDSSFLFESDATGTDERMRHLKARYTYLGECTDDGVVQFDKNSPACKMMREKSQGRDMTAMCARLQDKMREQCEQNMKNAMVSCQ